MMVSKIESSGTTGPQPIEVRGERKVLVAMVGQTGVERRHTRFEQPDCDECGQELFRLRDTNDEQVDRHGHRSDRRGDQAGEDGVPSRVGNELPAVAVVQLHDTNAEVHVEPQFLLSAVEQSEIVAKRRDRAHVAFGGGVSREPPERLESLPRCFCCQARAQGGLSTSIAGASPR